MPRVLHSPTYVALRRLLAEARRAADLTQADVAARMDRPQSFVSKYESGERRLDVVEFVEVCQVIGVSPGSVLESLPPGSGHLGARGKPRQSAPKRRA